MRVLWCTLHSAPCNQHKCYKCIRHLTQSQPTHARPRHYVGKTDQTLGSNLICCWKWDSFTLLNCVPLLPEIVSCNCERILIAIGKLKSAPQMKKKPIPCNWPHNAVHVFFSLVLLMLMQFISVLCYQNKINIDCACALCSVPSLLRHWSLKGEKTSTPSWISMQRKIILSMQRCNGMRLRSFEKWLCYRSIWKVLCTDSQIQLPFAVIVCACMYMLLLYSNSYLIRT